jgi:hypothetical protein
MTDEYDALYGDWNVPTNNLLVRLEPGVNLVDADRFAFASGNVRLDPRKAFHEIDLLSGIGELSFVVYCIERLYDLEYLASIEVQGTGFFGFNRENGLYVGVRHPARSGYTWYGPFTNQREWHLELPVPRSFVQPRGNYYIALAVADGDEVEISRMFIDVAY